MPSGRQGRSLATESSLRLQPSPAAGSARKMPRGGRELPGGAQPSLPPSKISPLLLLPATWPRHSASPRPLPLPSRSSGEPKTTPRWHGRGGTFSMAEISSERGLRQCLPGSLKPSHQLLRLQRKVMPLALLCHPDPGWTLPMGPSTPFWLALRRVALVPWHSWAPPPVIPLCIAEHPGQGTVGSTGCPSSVPTRWALQRGWCSSSSICCQQDQGL